MTGLLPEMGKTKEGIVEFGVQRETRSSSFDMLTLGAPLNIKGMGSLLDFESGA